MLLRSSLVKIARRNCHHFTPDLRTPENVANPQVSGETKSNHLPRSALTNTVQKQQKEIRELNNKLTTLSTDIDEQMEVIKNDMKLGYSLSCLLVVLTVAMRS
jgi:uncharacterized FlaG/YvyC family protein